MRCKLFITAIILGMEMVNLHAQEGFVSAGQTVSGNGGSQSYSFGQVFYLAPGSDEGNTTQGVQQSYEISVVDVSELASAITITLYPNPVTDYLTLLTDETSLPNLSFQLCDAVGNILYTGQNLECQTHIDMRAFTTGIYLLTVIRENVIIKTFKIVRK